MRRQIAELVRKGRRLRELLVQPRIGVYNGVAARDVSFPRLIDHEPEYKAVLIDSVREHVSPGDKVVVVGGERAVDAVHAARAGAASVLVYEAAWEAYQMTLETIHLNGVGDTVHGIWATVGEVVEAYGENLSDTVIAPAELPDVDVIILDCEGAEREILPHLDGDATVIVETHPDNGADTPLVLEHCNGEIVGPDSLSGHIVVGTTGRRS